VLSDVRAIAFDLDNTLWDVEPVLERAEQCLASWLHEHCPRMAQAVTPEDMRRARAALAEREPHNAHDLSYLRIAVLAAHAREHGYPADIAQRAFEVFLAARCEVRPYPDVGEGLMRLGRRYALASLSNGNADLERIGLARVFAVSLNARQIGAAKPHPRCFERLAAELSLGAAQILYVGDDARLDVEAARSAGFAAAWMNRRGEEWPAALKPADIVVRDCRELAAALGA
jgi:2-haloalkanoic acid dehalogenase type II